VPLTTRLAAIGLIGAGFFFAGTRMIRGQSSTTQTGGDSTLAGATSGPTFTINQQNLHSPLTIVAYGDMRFTDPANVTATNPTARKALVQRITEEKPDAILLNGDVPWHGGDPKDYEVYQTETQVWRDANLRIFPALGNHEFANCEVSQCLANWWATFPKLKGRRWYSLRLGTNVYAMAVDSDDSLLPGSDQYRWIENQVASLPHEIEFVLISMHHPPVADIQTRYNVDHNPRPNEIAFAQLLETAGATSRAKFIVAAGHIHNYERFLQDGIVYLVSGGGGAAPYPVDRTPPDLYQSSEFPNYHYMKFVLDGKILRATMYRLADPNAATWEAKDKFEIRAN
jgi:Calcineurin-like phosphoesterase